MAVAVFLAGLALCTVALVGMALWYGCLILYNLSMCSYNTTQVAWLREQLAARGIPEGATTVAPAPGAG